MEVTLQVPDEIAAILAQEGGDLARRALEAFAVDEFKAQRINEPQLGEMLGLTRIQMDGFLKAHGVCYDMTLADFERDIADLSSCLKA
jgi:hypothetical protein